MLGDEGHKGYHHLSSPLASAYSGYCDSVIMIQTNSSKGSHFLLDCNSISYYAWNKPPGPVKSLKKINKIGRWSLFFSIVIICTGNKATMIQSIHLCFKYSFSVRKVVSRTTWTTAALAHKAQLTFSSPQVYSFTGSQFYWKKFRAW